MCKYVLGSFDEKNAFVVLPTTLLQSVFSFEKTRARVRILNQGVLGGLLASPEFKGRKHALTSKDVQELSFSIKEWIQNTNEGPEKRRRRTVKKGKRIPTLI